MVLSSQGQLAPPYRGRGHHSTAVARAPRRRSPDPAALGSSSLQPGCHTAAAAPGRSNANSSGGNCGPTARLKHYRARANSASGGIGPCRRGPGRGGVHTVSRGELGGGERGSHSTTHGVVNGKVLYMSNLCWEVGTPVPPLSRLQIRSEDEAEQTGGLQQIKRSYCIGSYRLSRAY